MRGEDLDSERAVLVSRAEVLERLRAVLCVPSEDGQESSEYLDQLPAVLSLATAGPLRAATGPRTTPGGPRTTSGGPSMTSRGPAADRHRTAENKERPFENCSRTASCTPRTAHQTWPSSSHTWRSSHHSGRSSGNCRRSSGKCRRSGVNTASAAGQWRATANGLGRSCSGPPVTVKRGHRRGQKSAVRKHDGQ